MRMKTSCVTTKGDTTVNGCCYEDNNRRFHATRFRKCCTKYSRYFSVHRWWINANANEIYKLWKRLHRESSWPNRRHWSRRNFYQFSLRHSSSSLLFELPTLQAQFRTIRRTPRRWHCSCLSVRLYVRSFTPMQRMQLPLPSFRPRLK